MDFLEIFDGVEEVEGGAETARGVDRLSNILGDSEAVEKINELRSSLSVPEGVTNKEMLTRLNSHFEGKGVEFEEDSFKKMDQDQKDAYKKIAEGTPEEQLTSEEQEAMREFEYQSPDADIDISAHRPEGGGGDQPLEDIPPEETEQIGKDSVAKNKASKTGEKLSKVLSAARFTGVAALVGFTALGGVLGGKGIKDGSETDDPDKCPQTPVEKQTCENTIKARQEYHEIVNAINNFMDILFDTVSVGALYGIFGLLVFVSFFLIYRTLKNSYKKNTGFTFLYGIALLFFVSIVAFPFSMWFFRSPRQKCIKPTPLATVDPSTCPVLLQAGSCFR